MTKSAAGTLILPSLIIALVALQLPHDGRPISRKAIFFSLEAAVSVLRRSSLGVGCSAYAAAARTVSRAARRVFMMAGAWPAAAAGSSYLSGDERTHEPAHRLRQ